MYRSSLNPDYFNTLSKGYFPEVAGIIVTHTEEGKFCAQMEIRKELFAPNGFVHAGSIITFADTVAGYAAFAHLPESGKSFTTLELKSNFIKAVRKGTLKCLCFAEHLGKTTQVWRAEIIDMDSGKRIALFSCTQLILY